MGGWGIYEAVCGKERSGNKTPEEEHAWRSGKALYDDGTEEGARKRGTAGTLESTAAWWWSSTPAGPRQEYSGPLNPETISYLSEEVLDGVRGAGSDAPLGVQL